jgi:hypothetical protein
MTAAQMAAMNSGGGGGGGTFNSPIVVVNVSNNFSGASDQEAGRQTVRTIKDALLTNREGIRATVSDVVLKDNSRLRGL